MAGLPSWMVEPAPTGSTVDMRIRSRVVLAHDVVALEFCRVDGAEAPEWTAGAHVDLHLPNGVIRQYSLCGDSADREALRVAVLREPNGRGGSAYLHDVARVGDELAIGGPRNHFALEPSRRYRFIAGGIGITPFVPMMAEATAAGAEWTLAYGGRSRASMAFLPEFGRHPAITIVPQEEAGLLDIAALLAEPSEDTLVYCCGPEPLLHAVEAAVTAWKPDRLRVERFAPSADVPDGPGDRFDVVLARSNATLTVEPGRSILETVAAAGISVPSSCQEGTCGTCETLVLEGELEHRDSILSPAEQAAGDCMMICVSRARSDRLVLDL